MSTDLSLGEIYELSVAKYKLLYNDQFRSLFSRDFVRIKEGRIYSYPMKGTIDASIPDAENIILNDEKEMAEHDTIVDLIRNDLSMVSDNVQVTRYRYADRIETMARHCSRSVQKLQENFRQIISATWAILFSLCFLPGR